MKTVNAIAATAIGIIGSASGFSLDFSAYAAGTPLNPDIVVAVPGFGTVTFTEAPTNTPGSPPSELEITDAFIPKPGIGFEDGEQMTVTFQATDPNLVVQDVVFVQTGVSAGENFTISSTATPDDGSRLVSFSGAGDGAAIFRVGFNAVPEPSSTLLVAMSALGFVVRRRR